VYERLKYWVVMHNPAFDWDWKKLDEVEGEMNEAIKTGCPFGTRELLGLFG
jgi:hypothetical protein